TPILDIKPYLPYTDSHPDALGGFGFKPGEGAVAVECPPALLEQIPAEKVEGLLALLAQDPRPGYTDDPARIFGMEYAGFDIRFKVEQNTLKVCQINPLKTV
ncbi:MAG: tRNA (N6-threonylcarbamoyladenosine(37)-N6)-methyltransferase TrmO, partial [Clostridia bacterium]|nr:tRNA (N6-threonylcarbamoyladenosine(37)-N6)-methyltransferase TrmO [Clostridia bacterium]